MIDAATKKATHICREEFFLKRNMIIAKGAQSSKLSTTHCKVPPEALKAAFPLPPMVAHRRPTNLTEKLV